MLPGFNKLSRQMPVQVGDKDLKRVEAIILSMTPKERRKPQLLNGSRKRRIAAGSGTQVMEINDLLKRFQDMQKLVKQLSRGRFPNLPGVGNLFGGGGGPFGA